ncbi:hypothetical protein CVS40_3423 [Lucilia cuprina]|nr:hypothetical protein CVS40_3423 [Lucilia cuprina]KAI8126648.1 hypothetical protein CVS40_3423 [Lucilia cuprina]
MAYKNLYKAINDDKEPLNITRISDTRWLSINVAVKRILNQWLELETHFGIARLSEKCYSAETLHKMYKDPVNLIYLSFLNPILSDINVVNMSFQSNNSDPTKRINDLNIAINSLKNKICDTEQQYEIELFENYIKPNGYLGYQFETELRKHKTNGTITSEKESEIRQRCVNFCVSLLKQLIQRLPENRDILSKIDCFSVNNIFQLKKENVIPYLEHFGCSYSRKNLKDFKSALL